MSALYSNRIFSKVSLEVSSLRNKFGYSNRSLNKRTIMAMHLEKDPNDSVIYTGRNPPVSLLVLGSGAKGAPRSVLLLTPELRYLFNCGGGLQRVLCEHKIKAFSISDIFITQNTWECMGGLLGTHLTMKTFSNRRVTMHGPPFLEELFREVQAVVNLGDNFEKTSSFKVYDQPFTKKNKRMSYQVVPIYLNGSSSVNCESSKADTSAAVGVENLRKGHILGSICYIFTVLPPAPQLDITSCVRLKVPPGSLLGDLKHGKDVTLKDGRVIRSQDVTFPKKKPVTFLVVDCPNKAFLEDFVNEKEFHKHQGNDETAVVVHFSPPEVVNNPKYMKWIDQFCKETKHLLINEDNKCLGIVSPHRMQYQLNLIHPRIFPLLHEGDMKILTVKDEIQPELIKWCRENDRKEVERKIQEEILDTENSQKKDIHDSRICKSQTLTRIDLRPRVLLERSSELALFPQLYRAEALIEESTQEEINLFRSQSEAHEREFLLKETKYPIITFLGTGSSAPTKSRDCSGILFQLDKRSYMLLDCAEGIYAQLLRHFGDERTVEILKNLKAIYISHIHCDHHYGLIPILKARSEAFGHNFKSLNPQQMIHFPVPYLLAPGQIEVLLNFWSNHFEGINGHFKFINNKCFIETYSSKASEIKDLYNDLEMKLIKTVYVEHCKNSYGVAFTHMDGWKISYSGDARPSNALIEIGRNSDLLIHEATMTDEYKILAVSKRHSTVSEAVDVGRRMNAKFTLLTHFSQRFVKIPLILQELQNNVGIALDNMSVNFYDLHLLPKMYPVLKSIFSSEVFEMEEKYRKRQNIERFKRRNETVNDKKVKCVRL